MCLRYEDINEGVLREDSVESVQASDVTGRGLSELILLHLKNGVKNGST